MLPQEQVEDLGPYPHADFGIESADETHRMECL